MSNDSTEYRRSSLPSSDPYCIKIADWFVMAGADVTHYDDEESTQSVALMGDVIHLMCEPICYGHDHELVYVDEYYSYPRDHIVCLSGMVALEHSLPQELVEKLIEPIQDRLEVIDEHYDFEVEAAFDPETGRHWVWVDRRFTVDDFDAHKFDTKMREYLALCAEVEEVIF